MMQHSIWLLFGTIFLALIFLGILIFARNNRKFLNISNAFFQAATSSIISGILVGLVVASASYYFSYSLWKTQEEKNTIKEKIAEEQRITDIRLDAFIRIAGEVSENRLRLTQDIKNKAFARRPLKTQAWEEGKYKLPIKTPLLYESLLLLYYEIEKYNWDMSFICHKIQNEKLTKDKMPNEAIIALKNIENSILNKLIKLEELTGRELVILNQKTKEEYIKHFGEWKNDVEMPYFKKQNKNP